MKACWAVGIALGLNLFPVACATRSVPSAPSTPSPPSGTEWREGREALTRLREQWQPSPGVMRVTVQLRHAPSGRLVHGRGVLARRPPRALRMVLLGPGGLTALDFWARDERWRFAVPARDLVVRGDTDTRKAAARGLPVAFLRWWLLRPLAGSLVAVQARDGARELVLRDESATLRVRSLEGGGLQVTRRRGAETEVVRASAPGCATALYEHVQAGLSVQVTCESWEAGDARLDPRVFDEPQAQ